MQKIVIKRIKPKSDVNSIIQQLIDLGVCCSNCKRSCERLDMLLCDSFETDKEFNIEIKEVQNV